MFFWIIKMLAPDNCLSFVLSCLCIVLFAWVVLALYWKSSLRFIFPRLRWLLCNEVCEWCWSTNWGIFLFSSSVNNRSQAPPASLTTNQRRAIIFLIRIFGRNENHKEWTALVEASRGAQYICGVYLVPGVESRSLGEVAIPKAVKLFAFLGFYFIPFEKWKCYL